jgi:TM2 domain-containing membrane protein YozV
MIIKCLECGGQVSDKALVCPHCGFPLRANVATPGRIKEKKVSGLRRSVAFVFALFLGVMGAHNSYLGYNKKANIEFVIGIVGLVTSAVGIGIVVLIFLWIWALVEALSYRTDADGLELEW